MNIDISAIIHELELMNPDDKCGILDTKTKHIYEIKKLTYNPDVGAFIFIPDTTKRLISASMRAKSKLIQEDKDEQ